MELFFILIALAVMVVGLVGIIVPFVPGLPLMYLSYLLYGFVSGWEKVTLSSIVLFGIITLASLFIDISAGALGAKKYGASKSGFWGAILGVLFGSVIFGFFGLFIGPILGAFIGELIDGKPHPLAARATWGTVVGLLAGSFVKLIVGVCLVGVFLWQVIS